MAFIDFSTNMEKKDDTFIRKDTLSRLHEDKPNESSVEKKRQGERKTASPREVD